MGNDCCFSCLLSAASSFYVSNQNEFILFSLVFYFTFIILNLIVILDLDPKGVRRCSLFSVTSYMIGLFSCLYLEGD